MATDGAGNWVAIGNSGAVTWSSDGGATWGIGATGTANALQSVTYDASTARYVTVGQTATTLWTPFGVSLWTVGTNGAAANFAGVRADGAGRIVALGTSVVPEIVLSSDGGANWFAGTPGTASGLFDVVDAGGGVWLGTGQSGTIIRSTDNGSNWSPVTPATANDLRAIAIAP